MILFKKQGEETYLVTNYKVMFSTLSAQSNFIQFIPYVYKNDPHLYPQHFATGVEKHILKTKILFKLRFKGVFKIENKEDIAEMANLFKIDLSLNLNSTDSIREKIKWSYEDIQLINNVYSHDFNKFGYKILKLP